MYKILALLIIFITANSVIASEYKYILNESNINSIYEPAKVFFHDTDISVIKEAQGVILRFRLKNPDDEYKNLSKNTINKIAKIEYFLAKIKNFAIIEVHLSDFAKDDKNSLKKWEISTIIANSIEVFMSKKGEGLNRNRIISIGYGEFLPQKNTPNNGGKYNNRVDIIILCDINGD